MKEIKLLDGKIALVDDEDFDYLNERQWNAYKNNNVWYAYALENYSHKQIYMHRVIMGNPLNQLVDHRDHDGLNNQRYNLRISTRQQNSHNSRAFCTNSSGYKGVSLMKKENKWKAYVYHSNKQIYLGCFSSKEEAALAYNKTVKELFGEFACLNNILHKRKESGQW